MERTAFVIVVNINKRLWYYPNCSIKNRKYYYKIENSRNGILQYDSH